MFSRLVIGYFVLVGYSVGAVFAGRMRRLADTVEPGLKDTLLVLLLAVASVIWVEHAFAHKWMRPLAALAIALPSGMLVTLIFARAQKERKLAQ